MALFKTTISGRLKFRIVRDRPKRERRVVNAAIPSGVRILAESVELRERERESRQREPAEPIAQ